MARPGITQADVFSVANELLGHGKNPTIEQIRLILKSGSNSTIGMHLKSWKATRQEGEAIAIKEDLPIAFINAARQQWEVLKGESEAKLRLVEEEYAKAMTDMREELGVIQSSAADWERKHNQVLQAKTRLESANATLEQGVALLNNEKVGLENKIDAQRQQLSGKQERIDELHRLHQQSQANLEHFRESTREQRAIEQAQFEEQTMQMQQEIKMLQEQHVLARDKIVSMQHENKSLQHDHQRLGADCSKLEVKYEKLTEQVADFRAAKQEHQQASKHFEKLYNQAQKALDAKASQLIDVQSDSRVLSQQLKDSQAALKDQQDQVKHLAQEKWLLAQEKAQLEGRLREQQIVADTSC